MKALFLTSPHSGEDVPEEVTWLSALPEPVLMCDVDRYVDQLYRPVVDRFKLPFICAQWHRYVVDLNRLPEDIDPSCVEGAAAPLKFPIGMGVHWSETTRSDVLLKTPLTVDQHQLLIKKYYLPFHELVAKQFQEFKSKGCDHIFHLDCHSMPSQGGRKHNDQGQKRPDIVISDLEGKSSRPEFKDLAIESFKKSGFEVSYNWPYKGGRLTETYGHPSRGQSTLQVELNRSLYMNEVSKHKNKDLFDSTAQRLSKAVEAIYLEVKSWS